MCDFTIQLAYRIILIMSESHRRVILTIYQALHDSPCPLLLLLDCRIGSVIKISKLETKIVSSIIALLIVWEMKIRSKILILSLEPR